MNIFEILTAGNIAKELDAEALGGISCEAIEGYEIDLRAVLSGRSATRRV